MKAMVLAAGRGTRLHPLTKTRPKALVEIEGRTLLEIVLHRLRDAGVTEVMLNLHHLGDQIETYLAARSGFGLRIAFSREADLLDTGGGLKRAAWFFDDGRPFIVHNVDVLSDIDLRGLVHAHVASGALATLAAMPRRTARSLLFDQAGLLCGRVDPNTGDRLLRPVPPSEIQRLGFCGVHVVTPSLLERLTETGAFSIIDSYLRLASEGAPIRVHRLDHCRWRDAGRLENLRPL